MQILSLKLGGDGQLFAASSSVRLPFPFPTPVEGAYAILRGTRFERAGERGSYYSFGPDEEVKVLEVSLLSLFDGLQSKTDGQVQVSFRLDSAASPDLVEAQVDVLVIGV